MSTMTSIAGIEALEVEPEGAPLGSEQDALDLIGETYGTGIGLLVVPVSRLHPDFLVLRTRMAGHFLQKLQNYGFRCAIVGDVTAAVAASTALRDFVTESNRIGQVLFAPSREELERLLARR